MVEKNEDAQNTNPAPTETIAPPSDLATPRPVNGRSVLTISVIILLVLVALGAGAFANRYLFSNTQPTNYVSTSTGQDGNKTVTQSESDIAAVAAKVGPSVVSVITSIRTNSFYGGSQQAAGTGIIVSKDGYIMTNYHVIEGGSTVSVVDSDGNTYDEVEVIGRDPLNDVAYLKINSDKTFTPAEIGDSSTARIGQQVVAIGNALGQYQNTVTSGIISGTGRPVTASSENGSSEDLTDLLQTDASINQGNSGGPLLNLAGQVIGINTAIADKANGIGFAIPINGEKGILAGVLATGKISRAYLGVNYLSVTPDIAKDYKLDVKEGAYVFADSGSTAVDSEGPAGKAGVKDDDIIQKVNDQTVGKQGGLSTILGEYQPGDTVRLTILRDGKTITVDVTLGKYSA